MKLERDTCLDVLPKVTGEALYYLFLDVMRKRLGPTSGGTFEGREWYEVDSICKEGWEKVAAEVKAKYEKPTLTQLRLETKVADAALKWWKVEEFMRGKPSADQLPSYALTEFIVKLLKEE